MRRDPARTRRQARQEPPASDGQRRHASGVEQRFEGLFVVFSGCIVLVFFYSYKTTFFCTIRT